MLDIETRINRLFLPFKAKAIRAYPFHRLVMLALFALTILVFLDAPLLAMAWRQKPFPGFVVEQTLVVGNYGVGNGSQAGPHYPERVVEIAGRQVRTAEDFASAISSLTIGQRVDVRTVSPDGQAQFYQGLEVQTFPGSALFRLFWLPYLIGLVYLGIGAWVYRMRWQNLPARAFGYLCVSSALASGLLFDLTSTHAAPALWTLAVAQLGGALMSLALLFPQEWSPVKRLPSLRFLPYLLSIGLMAWGLLVVVDTNHPLAYITAWRASYIALAFGILAFLGVMFYRLFTDPEIMVRQQARIVLWGSLLAFTPIGIWAGAPVLNVIIPWNPTLFLPFLLIFPLSIGLAILRYRLWEIDVIVNRTLVYGALTITLVLIYWVTVVALEQVFRSFTGSSSPLSSVLSTLVIAGSFNPLRRNIQTAVDRRFYRQKYDAIKTLAAFSAGLRDEVDLDNLIESLEAVIRETVHPAQVLAWTRDARGFVLHHGLQRKDEGPNFDVRIPLEDPLVGAFQGASSVLDLDRVSLVSNGLQQLRSMNLELILPLISQKKLIGWLGLGPRLADHDYSTDDRSLLANLSAQAGPAVRVAQLVKMRQEDALKQERVEHELRVARKIQYALLPNHLPDLPGWKVASYYQPARAVGGDFYDFLFLEDGRIAVFIGDVTDKGVPAALVMATTRSLLRAAALQVIDPGQVLAQVNDLLLPDIPTGMFVTCLFALLDPSTGCIRFANAGHNLPVLRRDGTAVEIRATGMPLGLMPDMQYEEKEFEILPGECILLYSDGLVEAHNPEREMFGFGRMREMAASEWEDASSIIQCLLSTLKSFTGDNWEQEDDVTLVALKRA